MIEAVVGTPTAERVLLFLYARQEGYAPEIARVFGIDTTSVRGQLGRMERDGLLISKLVGKTRIYQFNPRYPFLKEVLDLLARVMELAPKAVRDKLLMDRRRPRQTGKPLVRQGDVR